MNSDFSIYLENIEKEIRAALPFPATAEWEALSFGGNARAPGADTFKPLLEPTRTLIDLGGKRWRPLLLVLAAEAAGAEGDLLQAAYRLVPLVEFVHTASLIHDDIEDSSDTRRGQPAAHIRYGTDTAINAGSWLYFEAPVCIDALPVPAEQRLRLYQTYLMELRRLHLGQAMDIAWHRDATACPGPEQYLAMVRCKTGTLASLAAKAGVLLAGADDGTAARAGSIAADIGAGFQIIDDVINLTTGNPGKRRGDDIVEGKKSLPVLLFAEKAGTASDAFARLVSCFREAGAGGIASPAVEQAIALLAGSGAIAEARKRGAALINGGCEAFGELFGRQNPAVGRINTLFTSMIPAILA